MKIMPKLLAAILVASVLFASAAFAETEEAADLLTRVLSVVSDADDLIELYEEDLEELMGIEPDDCADFAYLAPRDALSGREVIVILAVDEEAAERVAALLQNYLEGRRKPAERLDETGVAVDLDIQFVDDAVVRLSVLVEIPIG